MSSSKETKHHTLLTDESKNVLLGYHKIQMKRDQLINPAESAIIPLLDLLEDVVYKQKRAEGKAHAAEERADRLEQYNTKLRDELKEWRNKEREMAGQLSMLKTDKANLEELVQDLERRMAEVKKLIHRNLDDTVQYDKFLEMRKSRRIQIAEYQPKQESSESTEEDEVRLRYNRGYRRSQSVEPVVTRKGRSTTHSKRTRTSQFEYIDEESENNENDPNVREPSVKRSRSGRVDEDGLITTITKVTVDVSGRRPTRGSIEVHKTPKKRSVSASRILDEGSARRRLIARSPRIANAISNTDLRHKTPTGIGSSWTRGRPITECSHKFVPHRALIGSCNVCNRQINIMSKNVICEHCKIRAHEQCQKKAPFPCLPVTSFPATPNRGGNVRIALPEYCPVNPPYIPALLIRCICALEKNRLNTEGIYRVPGSKEEVDRLYKEFSKYIPNLDIESTEVITSCIKLFLRKLKEPLIPRSSYNEFMKSAEDDERLIESISELPEPNRDTLAYLCLHLQKVAFNSSVNKMPIENLARTLCPTILGDNSHALNTLGHIGNHKELEENARQCQVLKRLLNMPSDFWSDYLNTRTAFETFSSATPTTHRVPRSVTKAEFTAGSSGRADCSVLGPVSSTPPANFTPSFANSRRIKEPLF